MPPALAQELQELSPLKAAERVARPPTKWLQVLPENPTARAQLIIDRYESRTLTSNTRKKFGVFYTPATIISVMLDRLPSQGEWLDPAAGAGAFLVGAVARHGSGMLDRLHACDVDEEALDVSAFALEAYLGSKQRDAIKRWRRSKAFVRDFLRQDLPGSRPDVIIGNPPYGLDGSPDLPALFPALKGEKDLYACFLVRSIERIADDGTVALLVPDSWLTNQRAVGLRQALGTHGVARLIDFGKPFPTARDTRVHAVFLRQGALHCDVEQSQAPLPRLLKEALLGSTERGWFAYRTSSEVAACARIESAPSVGSLLDVLYGLRTGSNTHHVVTGTGAVPLVAGRDLEAFDRAPSSRHLRHAEEFALPVARQRGRWKIGIQRIRTNSSTPWRRWVEAALLSPDEVGLDSLTLLADRQKADAPSEALLHALGVLNSSILNRWYRLTFTDVNVKPVYVESIPLAPFRPEIAALVRLRLSKPGDLTLERAIDRLTADAYGLTEEEISCLERGFWGDDLKPMPSLEEARSLTSEPDRRVC